MCVFKYERTSVKSIFVSYKCRVSNKDYPLISTNAPTTLSPEQALPFKKCLPLIRAAAQNAVLIRN